MLQIEQVGGKDRVRAEKPNGLTIPPRPRAGTTARMHYARTAP